MISTEWTQFPFQTVDRSENRFGEVATSDGLVQMIEDSPIDSGVFTSMMTLLSANQSTADHDDPAKSSGQFLSSRKNIATNIGSTAVRALSAGNS
jgi:hypothetical protein